MWPTVCGERFAGLGARGFRVPVTRAYSLAPRVHLSRCKPLGGLAAGSRFPHFGSSYPGLGHHPAAGDYLTPQDAFPLRASLGPSSQDCVPPDTVDSTCSRPRRSRATRVRPWPPRLSRCIPRRGRGSTRGCHPSSWGIVPQGGFTRQGVSPEVAIRVSYRAISYAYRQLRGEEGYYSQEDII
jgi:hypothetical protein